MTTLYDVVLKVLKNDEQARNSDKTLTWEVWKALGFATTAMTHRSYLDPRCPTPESITRARRHIQRDHPELEASATVKEFRAKKEKTKGKFVKTEKVAEKKKGHWEVVDEKKSVMRFVEDKE